MIELPQADSVTAGRHRLDDRVQRRHLDEQPPRPGEQGRHDSDGPDRLVDDGDQAAVGVRSRNAVLRIGKESSGIRCIATTRQDCYVVKKRTREPSCPAPLVPITGLAESDPSVHCLASRQPPQSRSRTPSLAIAWNPPGP